jgi:predicted nuclease with TOPRIM domain
LTPEVMQILIPAVTAIVGSIVTLLIAKGANKKDVTMNDRRSLSEDEKAFRKELKDAINEYKVDLEGAREEIKALSVEVAQLHQINLELTLDNKRLQDKVDELREEVQRFREGGN